MLKTSARSELCLRLVGLSLGSSTRESTLLRVLSAVSAAIVRVEQQTKVVGVKELDAGASWNDGLGGRCLRDNGRSAQVRV